MIEDYNAKIKIVAKTTDEFESLNKFRDSLPTICKPQIDSVENGFSVNTVTYKDHIQGVVWLPPSPREIAYDGKFMRAYYNTMMIVVPCQADVQKGIRFSG
jgi:hypothetical protein